MAKILWLSGEYLLPADSGLYRYSLDMLNALREMGHKVRAIGRARSADDSQNADDDGTWTILPHRNVPMWKKMAHPAPVKVTEVWDRDYADAVQEALASYDPDIVLLDHLRVGAALDVIDGTVPSIYVSQNDETHVKEKMIPAAKGIRKAALFVDLKKMERFENNLLSRCDGVSAISIADIDTFQARNPKGPIVHTLPSYRGTRRPERTITKETPRRVAMISTLYWGAKIDNMVMALRGLKPLIDDGTEVVVFTGGYPPPDEVSRQYPKVRFEGYVDDFDKALADCRVGIVFEPVGGGFKMKTLDFIFHRVPLVTGHTSAMSLPLIPGKSVEEVRSETELAPLISSMLDDLDRLNDLQNTAFETCRDLFTSESARPLSNLVKAITSGTEKPK
ncbi:MAG: glycosyltransferase [Acidimicrobiales bacterium]|nr:glycosyltransferase [Acidimicrobiales bacterium]